MRGLRYCYCNVEELAEALERLNGQLSDPKLVWKLDPTPERQRDGCVCLVQTTNPPKRAPAAAEKSPSGTPPSDTSAGAKSPPPKKPRPKKKTTTRRGTTNKK